MGQLIVRNIDDELIVALKRRAARHGRAAEAEHREILREVLEGDEQRPSFDEFLASMPDVGTDEDFDPPRGMPRDVDLDA